MEFRMKTGFYETKMYDLVIRKGELIFMLRETDDPVITILEESVLNITLKKDDKACEMEIQTDERIYQGLLTDKMDYELLLAQLKENIKKKIVCEFNGGH